MPAKVLPLPRAIQSPPIQTCPPDRNQNYIEADIVVEQARSLIAAELQVIHAAPKHLAADAAGSALLLASRVLLELSICLQDERIKIRYPFRQEARS